MLLEIFEIVNLDSEHNINTAGWNTCVGEGNTCLNFW